MTFGQFFQQVLSILAHTYQVDDPYICLSSDSPDGDKWIDAILEQFTIGNNTTEAATKLAAMIHTQLEG